ncbi:lysophospholipid acyltransferase family protein [Salinisphaera sp.]|uniref:lysophospholipid acyltransferase family protein n=1 Tax=Salinisphaera sp. TaxID=1914330 RepID=UPI002D77C297|nr:1-acyl-sn-glycerol-3-phosphate acyltransferase [Salinisphaera sp.]HET7315570.1 1-acyl-sn-glycerol-3-phosphate acyltransferase [Salinisphaera sp.]
MYKKEAILPPDFEIERGSLIVSNHLRNSDIPILSSVLCRRKGLRFRFPLPFFATRDDIFGPRFLRDFLKAAAWPPPLPTLVGLVPLRRLLRMLRARPIRRVREFTLDHALTALRAAGLGDQPPERVLRPDTLRRMEACCGRVPSTLSALERSPRLGAMRGEIWGLRRLRLAAVQRLKPSFRATVDDQLRVLAELLKAGHLVYLAPEGTISETGGMSRIRQGAARLYMLTQRPPTIQPLALSYDPMRRGRLRAVVRVGTALTGLEPGDTRAFNATLRRALLSLYTITPSHLVARFLAAGPETFTSTMCAAWFERAVQALREAGLPLDPVLARVDAAKLVHVRLAWAARHRLLRREGGCWMNVWWSDAKASMYDAPIRVVTQLDTGFGEALSLMPELAGRIQP